MTEPRRATLEQWVAVRMMKSGDDLQSNAKILDLIPLASCLLELTDRIAALEDAAISQPAPDHLPGATEIPLAPCLLELSDRVATMEATFASHGEQISLLYWQHGNVVNKITDLQGCVNQLEAAATPPPAPTGGLVERIMETVMLDPGRAVRAIHAVADWLMKTQQEAPVGSALRMRQVAAMLREEADQ